MVGLCWRTQRGTKVFIIRVTFFYRLSQKSESSFRALNRKTIKFFTKRLKSRSNRFNIHARMY